jgi:RNA polymerase sigma-70 factor (ECF subfamily)
MVPLQARSTHRIHQSVVTRWSVIRGAALGLRDQREEFARRYAPVVRAYLLARWARSQRREDVDDVVQEVFVQCFRQGGALSRADRARAGGFRAFLYGVVRNVALKSEAMALRRRNRAPRTSLDLDAVPGSDEALSRIFDRAFAMSVLREARDRMAAASLEAGGKARKRFDLLLLRFHEGMPIREIARLWGVEAGALYAEQAKACMEFRMALAEVIGSYHPGTPGELRRQSEELLTLLKRD